MNKWLILIRLHWLAGTTIEEFSLMYVMTKHQLNQVEAEYWRLDTRLNILIKLQ